LEILLYCNRFQLATTDALYSDGDRYIPAVTAVNNISGSLQDLQHVLVLGAGLGSMVRVLHSKGCNPGVTLVDSDKVVLDWAMEFLAGRAGKVTPVCSDALLFMASNTKTYDLVFIDVFNGRIVPDFVYSPGFLMQCRECIAKGGAIAFNYIVNNKQEWEQVKETFTGIFPENKIVSVSVNRILLGKV
jgi:spermidine synthase